MTKKQDSDKQKINEVIEILKYVLSLDDEEMIKSTVESVVEVLEEINK